MPDPSRPALAPMLMPVTLGLLLWHLLLGADYVNARLAIDPGLPQLTLALELHTLWALVGWALAVWLGLGAALFMLWRDDASVLLLFAAAVSAGLAVAGDVLAGGAGALLGLPRVAVLAALVVVPMAGWLYARARHASGHLT